MHQSASTHKSTTLRSLGIGGNSKLYRHSKAFTNICGTREKIQA